MNTPRRPSVPAVPPVVLASTFTFDDTEGEALAASQRDDYLYSRWSNPTVAALEARLAALEGAERAIATGSGMAAVSLALLAASRRGGPVLMQDEVYGGTHELAETVLRGLGLDLVRVPLDGLVDAARALPEGATVYLEVPTNPTLRVPDLPAVAAAAPADALVVVDATFATPVLLRPLAHGAHLVVHSATKYLAGHHDVLAGVVAGGGPVMEEVWRLRKLLGPVLDPDAAYRVWRGLETLELRVLRQSETCAELARRLAGHPAVARVHHPGLPGHPDHARAARLLAGAGGVLSFEVAAGDEAAARVANALERFHRAPSLGGTRSLVSWPAGVSHIGLTADERARSGVSGRLLRLAFGLEPVEPLWADLEQALGRAAAAG